jgi:putative thioredoxin
MGDEVLAAGDAARAEGIFAQIIAMAPDNPAAVAGLAQAMLAQGRPDEAEAALAALPEDKAKDPAVTRARAGIALTKEAQPVAELDALAAEVERDPDNHEKRFELAGGLMAAGNHDAAADALLEIISRDRAWNDGAARDRLLKLFEAVGIDDPWTAGQRRKLSAILFS